jgi:Cytochrome C oxidase, cbb3-type, subunit III
MMTISKCEMNNGRRGMRSALYALFIISFALFTGIGCRQKMAEQPYYRPYEPSEFFSDGRSNRPLERGVINRAQHIEIDPLVTGITREEWARLFALQNTPQVTAPLTIPAPIENRGLAIGAPRYFPQGMPIPKDLNLPLGATAKEDTRIAPGAKIDEKGVMVGGEVTYVNEYPFPITHDDLKRGQERYTIYCAVCHGPLGNGQGKIWERGYLAPTSFHTEKVGEKEVDAKGPVPLGYSRGYALWGINIPMREVPVGYYFEVITKGYGGMPSYSAQIPPADRWRIIAYIRVLQLSQHATAANLPAEMRAKIEAGGKP